VSVCFCVNEDSEVVFSYRCGFVQMRIVRLYFRVGVFMCK